MSGILIDLGFIKIYWYSLFIFFALLIGGTLALREGRKWGIKDDIMINMFFFLIPISIIGARLYYVIFNWSYYSKNVMEIFEIWEGGLAIHGGILFGLIYVLLYCARNNIKFFRMSDILVVSLIIGQAIGRWGNFFNQEAYGSATTLATLKSLHIPRFIREGMCINGVYYHPTFFYESLGCIIIFIILMFISKLKDLKRGIVTGIYFICYGTIRYFIEILRTDSLMFGNLKIAQVVSIIMVAAGIIIIVKTLRSKYA